MASLWSPVLSPRRPAAPQQPTLSVDAWAALPEGVPGELVDGHLTEEEVPDPLHELAVSWLIALLRAWLAGRGGFVFGSEVKLVVNASGGRKPDVTVYLPGGLKPPRRGPLRAPPDVAIEVISPSPRDERRDRIEKMAEYAAFGIRHYWLLDPALGSLEMFELGGDRRYAKVVGITSGIVEDIPGCPGLSLSLDALWEELERLGPEDERD